MNWLPVAVLGTRHYRAQSNTVTAALCISKPGRSKQRHSKRSKGTHTEKASWRKSRKATIVTALLAV